MSDKVSVGNILLGPQYRDAIHIAIAPVVAAKSLRPGQDIGFVDGSTTIVTDVPGTARQGIVDPFLNGSVATGDQFWMFLYPNTITSLRHEWTHPAFGQDNPPVRDTSSQDYAVKWLTEFATRCNLSYDQLMSYADHHVETGDCTCTYEVAQDTMFEVGSYNFWHHYAMATGKAVDMNELGNFFSCAC